MFVEFSTFDLPNGVPEKKKYFIRRSLIINAYEATKVAKSNFGEVNINTVINVLNEVTGNVLAIPLYDSYDRVKELLSK